MDKQKIIQNIFNILESQRFADWYHNGGNFDRWICGDIDGSGKRVSEEQIKQDIEKLFNIE